MEKPDPPLIIAMKGHPGTGKTTLARSIATALRCPLLDKDDIRDCTGAVHQFLPPADSAAASSLLNDLSYAVLWKMAHTQIHLGLSVVLDSPLSRRAHLESLLQLAASTGAGLVIVECKPGDEATWRRRLERRGIDGEGGSWHKPATWDDLQKLVEGYGGCTEYDVGGVPRIVVDTTSGRESDVDELVKMLLEFTKRCC